MKRRIRRAQSRQRVHCQWIIIVNATVGVAGSLARGCSLTHAGGPRQAVAHAWLAKMALGSGACVRSAVLDHRSEPVGQSAFVVLGKVLKKRKGFERRGSAASAGWQL